MIFSEAFICKTSDIEFIMACNINLPILLGCTIAKISFYGLHTSVSM